MPAADLAQLGQRLPLHDIRLPPPPGWWPPAPGWWLLAGLAITMVVGLFFFVRRHRRLAYRRQAIRELARLEGKNDLAPAALLAELSVLLRRAALCAFARRDCAGLAGPAWLAFLDRRLKGDLFSRGPGRCLASGPYRPACEIDRPALLALCRRWLRCLPPAPAPGRRS